LIGREKSIAKLWHFIHVSQGKKIKINYKFLMPQEGIKKKSFRTELQKKIIIKLASIAFEKLRS